MVSTSSYQFTDLGVHLERQHDFRSPVPSSRNVLRHQSGLLTRTRIRTGTNRPCETEVAHFEIAVGVDEQVRWLQVPVHDIRRVDGLEGTEDLVDEVLAMVVGQGLCSDDPVQIGLHELLDEVDLAEVLERGRFCDVEDADDLRELLAACPFIEET